MKKFLLILFVSSCLSTIIIGFYQGGLILFGDTDLTYHFANRYFAFDKDFIWNDYFQSGTFGYFRFQGYFIKKLIYFISISVQNIYFFGYMWFFIPFTLYCVTFYYFISNLIFLLLRKQIKSIIITSALISLIILNGVFIVYAGQTLYILGLVFSNLFLIFFTKNLISIKETGKNNYLFIVLMSLFLSETFIYIQHIILLFYVAVSFIPFSLTFVKKNIKSFVILGTCVSTIVILLNLGWIIPILFNLLHSSNLAELSSYNYDLALKQVESISNLIFMSELLGLRSYHIYEELNIFLRFAIYIPVFIFILEIIKRKGDRILISLFSIYLLFLLFSYGLHSTTSSIFLLFWNNVPLFNTFRTVMKFAFVPLYLVIIGVGYILHTNTDKKQNRIYILGLAIYLVLSLSMFNQEQFRKSFQQYKIPNYYFNLKKLPHLVNRKTIASTVFLPQTNWQTQYDWAPKDIDGMNILPYFIGPGNLVNGAQYIPDPAFLFNDYFQYLFKFNSIDDLKIALGIRNIDTIVFQNDVRFSSNKQDNEKQKINLTYVLKTFKENKLCKYLEQSGEIFFCKVNDEFFVPILTPKTNIISVKTAKDTDIEQLQSHILIDLQSLGISAPDDSVIFEDDILSEQLVYKKIYYAYAAQIIENCINDSLPCDKFNITDIPSDTYSVFFKFHPFSYLSIPETKTSQITFINTTESGLSEKSVIPFNIDSKNNSYIGNLSIKDGTVEIQTESSEYFNNGSFYLVAKDNNRNSKSPPPVVEFKKIDPTKYHIVIHNAPNIFLLQFLQNFDSGWKLLAFNNNLKTFENPHIKYIPNTIANSNKDRASISEIDSYIENNELRYYPRSENIDTFISEKLQNSIQNDAIPKEISYENSIDVPSHVKVLGYANGWVLNKSNICKNSICIPNKNGTYDAEFILEYEPQKLARIGLNISIATFILSLIFISSKLLLTKYHSK